MLTFSQRELEYLQTYVNEMYQSATLRDGPTGGMIISIRAKLLMPVDLTDAEKKFMLLALQDTFQTSRSSTVTSQYGSTMKMLGSSGTYTSQWELIQSCMTKLGLATLPKYQPLEVGPDGDTGGIATPMHHDINDGTGYNHR